MSGKRRGGGTYFKRHIEVMSVRYQWVERAEAWDLYLDRYRQLAQVTDIERMRSLIPSTMRRVPSSFSSRSSNSSDLFKPKRGASKAVDRARRGRIHEIINRNANTPMNGSACGRAVTGSADAAYRPGLSRRVGWRDRLPGSRWTAAILRAHAASCCRACFSMDPRAAGQRVPPVEVRGWLVREALLTD